MPAFDRFRADERAVEGLPIRLVVGVVVGVASLTVMLNMVNGVGSLAAGELDAAPAPEVVSPGSQSVNVTVLGPEGDPVADATVVVRDDTASVDGVTTATTGANGTATVEIAPSLGPNQAEGKVAIDVKPPAGSSYVDRRANAAILVVEGA